MSQDIELAYPNLALAIAMIVGAVYNYVVSSGTMFMAYSVIYCIGAVISFWHYTLLRDFFTEPDLADIPEDFGLRKKDE